MTISRRLARPMLASMFVAGGLDALRNPESKVKAADAVVGPLTEIVPSLPDNTETFVRVNGAIQVGAGVLLAVGKFRRLAALALIGSIIPTTYAGHRFWDETDEGNRAQQRIHFFKNLGLLGGLILEAVDTEGAPSLGWRARRQGRRVGQAVAAGRLAGEAAIAHGTGAKLNRSGKRGTRKEVAKAHETAAKLGRAGRRASWQAEGAVVKAGRAGAEAHETAAKLGRAGRRASWQAEGAVVKAGRAGAEAHETAAKLGRAGRRATKKEAAKAHETAAKLGRAGRRASWQAEGAVVKAGRAGADVAGPYLTAGVERAGPYFTAGVERAGPYLTAGVERAGPLLTAGAERAGEFLTAGTERAGEFLTAGAEHAGELLSKAHHQLPVG
jgi:uncharacterized membrane protein YphA (DoxX/SURF4 family)